MPVINATRIPVVFPSKHKSAKTFAASLRRELALAPNFFCDAHARLSFFWCEGRVLHVVVQPLSDVEFADVPIQDSSCSSELLRC